MEYAVITEKNGRPVQQEPVKWTTDAVPAGQYAIVKDPDSEGYLRVPGRRVTNDPNANQSYLDHMNEPTIIQVGGKPLEVLSYKPVNVIENGKMLTAQNPNYVPPQNMWEFEAVCAEIQAASKPESQGSTENYATSIARNKFLLFNYKTTDAARLKILGASAEEIERYQANSYPTDNAYLTRGAMLRCPHGSHRRRLELLRDHAVYTGHKPVVHEMDCIVGDDKNIRTFGVCSSSMISGPNVMLEEVIYDSEQNPVPTGRNVTGCACRPYMMCAWQEPNGKTRIVQEGMEMSYRSITTESWLYCMYSKAGEIIPVTSGQEFSSIPIKKSLGKTGRFLRRKV